MNDHILECPNCGIQTEVTPYYLDDPAVVKCEGCNTSWAVEAILGDCWLEPLHQIS